MSAEPKPRVLLTVDVEDWRRGLGLDIPPGDTHLVSALDVFLYACADTGIRATFFVLGVDAPGLRDLLRRAAASGHEIACHGMRHRRVDGMTAEEFRRDVRQAKALIEELSAAPCRGYRAPWFSLGQQTPWAFRVLAEEGFAYDASLRLPLGDDPPEEARAAGIVEVPVPLATLAGLRVGVLGGTPLRLLPPAAISRLVRRCDPACIYLHPYDWQGAPGMGWGLSPPALRRRLLVSRTLPRLARLAGEFDLRSIAEEILRGQG